MNQLVTNSQSKTMSSIEIAELTEKRHSDVMRDIRVIQEQLDERKFAVMSHYVDSSNRKQGMWILDYNETMVLLTGYSVKMRMKVIDRWQELEQKSQPQIPTNFAEALQLAADQAKQLELAAPKVAFVDNYVEKTNLLNATQVGQKFKMSAVRINKFLDAIGGVYNKNVKRGRAFTQSFVDKGYGEMKTNEMGYPQALFTTKGDAWIHQQLVSEGVI